MKSPQYKIGDMVVIKRDSMYQMVTINAIKQDVENETWMYFPGINSVSNESVNEEDIIDLVSSIKDNKYIEII